MPRQVHLPPLRLVRLANQVEMAGATHLPLAEVDRKPEGRVQAAAQPDRRRRVDGGGSQQQR